MTYDNIIKEFDAHMKKSGCRYYSDFYVGITNDARRRLFDEHHVDKDHQWWIFSAADNEDIARQVEQHYLKSGMRGSFGGGKGDGSAIYVYSYVVTPKTIE